MYLLAIETTGQYGSAAVINEKKEILGYHVSKDTMNHLKDLMPMVDACLVDAGIKKTDLTHVSASIGPGSFTGIRIGVSTARVLSQVLKIPAVPAPTLESFRYKEGFAEPGSGEAVAVILNARRRQVYGSLICDGRYVIEPQACMIDDILKTSKENGYARVLFYGDGIDAYEKIIIESGINYEFAEKENRYQDAKAVARLAAEIAETDRNQNVGVARLAAEIAESDRNQNGSSADALAANIASKDGCNGRETGESFIADKQNDLPDEAFNYDSLKPEYMRQAEAEQKLASGQLPICKEKN